MGIFSRCKHSWVKQSDVVTESTFEMSLRNMKVVAKGNVTIPYQLCDDNRKHIVILTCSKCGKVEKLVTDL